MPPYDPALALSLVLACQQSYQGDSGLMAAAMGVDSINTMTAANDFAFGWIKGKRRGICFRGTDDLGGWTSDGDVVLEHFSQWPGRVHRGWARVYFGFIDWAERQDPTEVTGHSRGGGLATLLTARLNVPAYTFGAPMVGDETFSAAYQPPQWRVTCGVDPVPGMPSVLLGYRHVGTELHLPGSLNPDADAKVAAYVAAVKGEQSCRRP